MSETIDKYMNMRVDEKKKKKKKSTKMNTAKGRTKDMKYCNNCGRFITDDFPYCPECGMEV